MSRFVLIATNVTTAIVTAAVASALWLAVYSSAETSGEVVAAGDRTRPAPGQGAYRVELAEGLVVGPAELLIPLADLRSADLVDTFTRARAHGQQLHDAIDIAGRPGATVVAAAAGTIEKLLPRHDDGGVAARIRSEDGQWIYEYGNLDRHAPGLAERQRVERGQVIGTIASQRPGSPPHLHFEIRRLQRAADWEHATAVNPYPLLAGRKTSE